VRRSSAKQADDRPNSVPNWRPPKVALLVRQGAQRIDLGCPLRRHQCRETVVDAKERDSDLRLCTARITAPTLGINWGFPQFSTSAAWSRHQV
jgi:hypothetical protein